jgi:RNA polymerase sigma-32 factor
MVRRTEAERGSYISLVRRSPKLTRELEYELTLRWREQGDTSARDALVRSNLRSVVAIASRYRRETSATLEDLIAEGNFGLLHALAKFDPTRGTRFVTYAAHWIRALISQYLVRSRSIVTTGVQSKLLPKIRRERANASLVGGLEGSADDQIAERLALSPKKLRSLVERLHVRDVSWDASSEEALTDQVMEALDPFSISAEQAVLATEAGRQRSTAISAALSKLDVRERYIVERRLMAHREDELSLAEIGRRFCISRERARQIEARAVRKLKAALMRWALGTDWLPEDLAA